MIIKIGLLILVFVVGYRLGDAAGMERGYKSCIREVTRNCRYYGLWKEPEITAELRDEDIQKGLDDIYGKKEVESGADS